MKESQIEARLVRGVKALGGRAYKFVSPGNTGVPDRLVVLPGGRIIFVELKTDVGKLSPMQIRQIDFLRSRGVPVRVLYGMEAVEEFLKGLKLDLGGGGVMPNEVRTTQLSAICDFQDRPRSLCRAVFGYGPWLRVKPSSP